MIIMLMDNIVRYEIESYNEPLAVSKFLPGYLIGSLFRIRDMSRCYEDDVLVLRKRYKNAIHYILVMYYGTIEYEF